MRFVLKVFLTAVNVFLLASLLPGVSVNHFFTAIGVAFCFAILNAILKPILILLTLPATLLTFGLFLWVINACLILLDSYFINGFIVNGFWYALLFGLCLSFLNSVMYKLFLKEENKN